MSKYDGHTQGPWEIKECHEVTERIVSIGKCSFDVRARFDVIADRVRTIGGGYDELFANANLMADAPKLLAERDEAVALLKKAHKEINELAAYGGSTSMEDAPEIKAFLTRIEASK